MNLDLPRDSTQWNIPGTTTFRLSSRMFAIRLTQPPRDGKVGGNLQNKEGSMRSIYWADEGYKLCQRDQAGAEALIVAYLTRHGLFRDLFLYGIKPHIFVALYVFKEEWKKEVKDLGIDTRPDIDMVCNLPIGELTSYPQWNLISDLIQSSDEWSDERRFYYIGKQICHSANYGIKPGMFQLNTLKKSKGRIVISKRDAEFYLETYHSLFPEIHEWHRDVENQLNETQTLYNLFGFPRYFYYPEEYINPTMLKEALAFIPQSTVGSITNIAITKMQHTIEENRLDWHILQNNHDSFMTEFPDSEDEERECARTMKDYIEASLVSPRGEHFKMKSGCETGKNWGKFNEKNNPLGLRKYKDN